MRRPDLVVGLVAVWVIVALAVVWRVVQRQTDSRAMCVSRIYGPIAAGEHVDCPPEAFANPLDNGGVECRCP